MQTSYKDFQYVFRLISGVKLLTCGVSLALAARTSIRYWFPRDYAVRTTHMCCFSGSLPFLLKEHLSYSQLAIFSLASYPYSLKLLWSPIVDSLYFPSIGRRKSWIIPMQLIIGTTLLIISFRAEELMDNVRNRPLSSSCVCVAY